MSNGLDPDLDWHSVSSVLGPNYLKRLSEYQQMTKVVASKGRVKKCWTVNNIYNKSLSIITAYSRDSENCNKEIHNICSNLILSKG